METKQLVEEQRKLFLSGVTKGIDYRKNALKLLKQSIVSNMQEMIDAFKIDYNKCSFDVISTEVALVIGEIDYMLKHLRFLAKPKKVKTSLVNLVSHGYIYQEPYGVALIVAPWNYPIQLALSPLVGAIAAGNTAVVKPSNYCPNVSLVIKKILSVFEDNYVAVVMGGREQNAELFDQRFDFAFFTGGVGVGKLLLEKMSTNLTPTVLELGGKSPCIIDEDCDIDLAAKRSVWGKYLNAGQTCVAPDYFYVHKNIKTQFIDKCKEYIDKFYYIDGKITPNFPYIINDKHIARLQGLLSDKVIYGGKVSGRLLEPTIMDNVTRADAIMQEEIFGPIMPIMEFEDITQVVEDIVAQEKPLALYYFGKSKDIAEYVINTCSFGGGCINDTIMHLTEENLPFGGVGNSGMSSYHGKKSFEVFSHAKSVLKKGKLELSIKYPPYSSKKENFIKKFFGIK